MMVISNNAASSKYGGLSPSLSNPTMRLTAIVYTLGQHYGSSTPESKQLLDDARHELALLFRDAPPGILYLTLNAKEGVLMLAPDQASPGVASRPEFAVKRYQKLQQAENVDNLTQWLQEIRTSGGKPVTYLNAPPTKWPIRVNGYSVLFMDAIPGENFVALMPRLTALEQKADTAGWEAKAIKDFLFRLALDNVAYFQDITPQLLTRSGYALQPQDIRGFVAESVKKSATTLEEVTDQSLTESERRAVYEAADAAAELISKRAVLALDSGPRNILVRSSEALNISEFSQSPDAYLSRKGKPNLSLLPEAVYQVDLPYSMKTSHTLRDAVRFLFAPSSGLNREQIDEKIAYFILRLSYFSSSNAPSRMGPIAEQIGLLNNGKARAQSLPLVAEYFHDGPYDLQVSAIAESARMMHILTTVFMSKNRGQIEGTLTPTMDKDHLTANYGELEQETRGWASVGNSMSQELGQLAAGDPSIPALELLFQKWQTAAVQAEHLPRYKAFSKS